MSSERESLQLCGSQGLSICLQASRFFLHYLVELLPSLLLAAIQKQRLPEEDTPSFLCRCTPSQLYTQQPMPTRDAGH